MLWLHVGLTDASPAELSSSVGAEFWEAELILLLLSWRSDANPANSDMKSSPRCRLNTADRIPRGHSWTDL